MNWIKATRLPIAIVAGLMTLASFHLANYNNPIKFIVALAVMMIAVCAMLQNDWRDRIHDLKKGKSFAVYNERVFLLVLIYSWILSFTVTSVAIFFYNELAPILLFISFTALFYSEIRKIPFLPNFVVAISMALPALSPVMITPSPKSWFLFIGLFLAMYSREILEDIDDANHDLEYKWTLPTIIGTKHAKSTAGIILILTIPFLVIIHNTAPIVIPLMGGAAGMLLLNKSHCIARLLIHTCVIALLFVLFL